MSPKLETRITMQALAEDAYAFPGDVRRDRASRAPVACRVHRLRPVPVGVSAPGGMTAKRGHPPAP